MTLFPADIELVDAELRLLPVFVVPAEAILEAVRESLQELRPWLGWAGPDYSDDQLRSWLDQERSAWQRGSSFQFTILDADQRLVLGGAGLNHFNHLHRLANLGYWVRTSATRQGIGSRATRLLARFAFEHIGLLRTEIVVAEDNLPSQRTAEKAGATREGLLRQRLWSRGTYGPAWMFSLLPQDLGVDLAVVNAAWQRYMGSQEE